MYRNIGKITIFKGTKKIILHFDGSNNIFADYICIYIYLSVYLYYYLSIHLTTYQSKTVAFR